MNHLNILNGYDIIVTTKKIQIRTHDAPIEGAYDTQKIHRRLRRFVPLILKQAGLNGEQNKSRAVYQLKKGD